MSKPDEGSSTRDGMTTRTVPEALGDKLTAAAGDFAATFEDVGMGDIAKASGIPRATLYYYFAGKDDVLAFLLSSMLDDLRISVSTASEIQGDTQTRLRHVVRAQLAHLAANPATSRLLLMNLGKAGRLGVIASGVEASFHGPVRRILIEGLADGVLVDIDIDVAATAIYGAVAIVGLQALLMSDRPDVDALAASVFSIFWSGISRPVTPRNRRKTRT
jgi:TetR/AcrR family transcriptional regulator